MQKNKVVWIMLDSVGIGALPDANQYGDAGAHTLQSIAKAMPELELPTLNGMGLSCLVSEFNERSKADLQYPHYVARMAEQSKGKDTITGHWEFTGILTEEPFPTFPNGFPEPFIMQLENAAGVKFLGNEVASGTEIIARLGAEHIKTGNPILYTSADSVLQIAAHEEVIAVDQLYRICEIARTLTLTGPYKVGRVIARPFIGTEGSFVRTANRHDYALETPKENLLQDLIDAKIPLYAVGKIRDIYAGVSFDKAETTKNNRDGMEKTLSFYHTLCQQHEYGVIYVNLVDFDMQYGHRRDCIGYGTALAEFDAWLSDFIDQIDDNTVVIITADHGCDPDYTGTDHTREYVPLLVYGKHVRVNQDACCVTYPTFADLGATIAEIFGITYTGAGESFAQQVFTKEFLLKRGD